MLLAVGLVARRIGGHPEREVLAAEMSHRRPTAAAGHSPGGNHSRCKRYRNSSHSRHKSHWQQPQTQQRQDRQQPQIAIIPDENNFGDVDESGAGSATELGAIAMEFTNAHNDQERAASAMATTVARPAILGDTERHHRPAHRPP